MFSTPVRSTVSWILTVAVLATTVRDVRAEGGFLYGLNSPGTVSVNANKINGLPGSFDPDYPLVDTQQAWRDLALDGGDQYTLRGDGQLFWNGAKRWRLSYDSIANWPWIDLETASGTVYALRQDGTIAANGSVAGSVPRSGFYFTSLQVVGGATYALRADGSVFKNVGNTAVFNFRAGNGVYGRSDGSENDTIWNALRVDPTGQYLYALRTDGRLYRGRLNSDGTNGELVEGLPFPDGWFDTGDLYWDLEFRANGDWVILRVNGKIYAAPNALAEVVDFEGSGNSVDQQFLDLAVFNGRFFALRWDGKVFVEGATDPLLKLPGSGYGRLDLSDREPNLAGQKNSPPFVVQYKCSTTASAAVKLPIIATDLETPDADLGVTPGAAPAGAVWDAVTRTFTWTAPATPGKFSFAVVVADTGGSTNTYTSTVQVNAPDTDPAKNVAPNVPGIKAATPIVGHEYRLYIPDADADGDPVTVTVDPAAYPFNAGAVYNADTQEFVWTPTNLDIGKKTVVFALSDGTTTKKLNLKLEVKSPLFIPPLPL